MANVSAKQTNIKKSDDKKKLNSYSKKTSPQSRTISSSKKATSNNNGDKKVNMTKKLKVNKRDEIDHSINRNRIKIYDIFKMIFLAISLVLSGILISAVSKTNMIPMKFMIIIIIVLFVLNLIAELMLKSRRVWLNVISMILIILLSSTMVIGTRYVNNTMNVLKNFVSQNEEKTIYHVLTRKGIYTDINSIEGKIVGVLSQEAEILKKELNKSRNLEYKEYDSFGDLIYGLELNEIEAIIISETVYDYILEENVDIQETIEKVGEVEVVGKKPEISSNIDVGNSFIIYISGLDTRDTSSIATYGLSDVNIVVAVNPDTHKILLVSIPRDYYIYLYNRPKMKDKLTHAGLYGIETSMKTVADIFDINIDTYIKVNFKFLTTAVDEINGIDVYSDTDFDSSHIKGWHVPKGTVHMNGAQALAYSRERYAYASGDRHRGKNQTDVIKAIIKKVTRNPNYLLKYDQVLASVQPYFTTNIEMNDIQELVKEQINSMASWNVESISVNGTNSQNYTASWPKQMTYVMIPNQTTITNAKNKISEVMRGE